MLDIENDVLARAEKMAREQGTTTGKVISDLARRGMRDESRKVKYDWRNGVPVFPATGETLTMEKIQQMMDDEGI